MKTPKLKQIEVIAIVLQPSDEKSEEIKKAIYEEFPEMRVIDYGRSRDIGYDVCSHLVNMLNDYEILFISCHSGIKNAISGKRIVQEIHQKRVECHSSSNVIATICHYSTEKAPQEHREHIDYFVEKDPNDLAHTKLIKFFYESYIEHLEAA